MPLLSRITSLMMGCTESVIDDAYFPSCTTLQPDEVKNEKNPNPFQVDKSHYTFQHVVGSGGFGIVQCVVKRSQPHKNEYFAIKSLSKASVLKRRSGLSSIFTELKILTAISHPFICNSHCAFQDNTYLFLVLDLARGGDMRYNLSASGGMFTEYRAKFYVAQVILALEYLHRLGIIHRDVKPENILLDDTGYVKLTDYGVSKVINAKTGDCRSTSGTHGYMAPEMYIPPFIHGKSADWFATGVTLYEFLLGQRPFDSKTLKGNQCCEGGAMQLHLGFATPQDGSLLSFACQDLLRRLLHPRPEMRLTTLENSSPHRSSTQPSDNIREQAWFLGVDWQLLYNRALPPPFIPDGLKVRSCLSFADSTALLQKHLQAQAIPDGEQGHFAHYQFHGRQDEPVAAEMPTLVRERPAFLPPFPPPARSPPPPYPAQDPMQAPRSPPSFALPPQVSDGNAQPSLRSHLRQSPSSLEAALLQFRKPSSLAVDTNRVRGCDNCSGSHGACPSSSSVLTDDSDKRAFVEFAACYARRRQDQGERKKCLSQPPDQNQIHHQLVYDQTAAEEEMASQFGSDVDAMCSSGSGTEGRAVSGGMSADHFKHTPAPSTRGKSMFLHSGSPPELRRKSERSPYTTRSPHTASPHHP